MKEREKIGWIWDISYGERRKIVLNCTLGIISTLSGLAFIWSSKRVIDIATGVYEGLLVNYIIAASLLFLVQIVCSTIRNMVANRMQVTIANGLRKRIFEKLLKSRWDKFESYHSGDLLNRIELDTNNIVYLLSTALPHLIISGFQLIAAVSFLYILDPILPWLILLALPIFLILARYYSRKMQNYSRNIRKSDSLIHAAIQEDVQNISIVKTIGEVDLRLDRLDTYQDELKAHVYDKTRFSTISRFWVSLSFAASYLLVFIWGALKLNTGIITFGTMTAFLQLVSRIQSPTLDISRLIPSIINALTAAERLMELEELPPEEEGEKMLFEKTPDLYINNITFGYGPQERPVFEAASFSFPAASCTAVTGATGRGKTTLLRLLLALIDPEQGEITLRSEDCSVSVSPATRCNFVYVPQGNTLFSGTVRDNLLLGNPDATDIELHDVLNIACADFVLKLPMGLDSSLSEQGGGLSEGQAQRIAIARALLKPGKILLLDEATSALDTGTQEKLVDNLNRHRSDKTIIFITHNPEIAANCEREYKL